jgi:hypothetical protein
MIDTYIAGIPCKIALGYGSWSVCDRKRYPAKWLERKMTDVDIGRIEAAIAKWVEKNGRLY